MKLKDALKQKGIRLVAAAKAIGIGEAAFNKIVNHGVYPRNTPRAVIDQNIQNFLTKNGIHLPVTEETNTMRKITLSPQILAALGLKSNPFKAISRESDVYHDLNRNLVGIITNTAELGGIVAIYGGVGAGKTTLADIAYEQILEKGNITIVRPYGMIESDSSHPLTVKNIVNALIFSCSDERPKLDREARARQLNKILETKHAAKQHICLFIDEAHLLHTQTLLGLKRLLELKVGRAPSLRLVLIGQQELKTRFQENRSPDLAPFIQRCDQYELLPMDFEQFSNYVRHCFQNVDGLEVFNRLFKDDGLKNCFVNMNKSGLPVYPLSINNYLNQLMVLIATKKDCPYTHFKAAFFDFVTRQEIFVN